MATKKKKAQMQLLEEIKKQLIIQAERWGRTGFYTPLKLEEMELEQCRKILGEFFSEKANLEYELQMLESDTKEAIIKLERLENYVNRAKGVILRHQRKIKRLIEKLIGDREKTNKAVRYLNKDQKVSVLLESRN